MTLAYIRETYGVPAKRGARITYTDSAGVVVNCAIKSENNGHLMVQVIDKKPGQRGRMRLHPTWHVEYLAKPEAPSQPSA